MTVAIKQACENRGGQAGSSPLISLSLGINLDLDLNGSTDEERRELWRIALAGLFYATRLKVMPYHIWHPKAWDIDPAVWPLIGLGFEHQLGPSVEGRVRSGMCDRLSSFVMGIDDLPPWGRLAQSGHSGHSLSYICVCATNMSFVAFYTNSFVLQSLCETLP